MAKIAVRTGLSEPTLRHYYFRELNYGAEIVRAEIVSAVFEKAKAGNAACAKLALELLDKGGAVPPVARRAAVQDPAEKPLGKKAAADREAHTAHEGTEWGDLLH